MTEEYLKRCAKCRDRLVHTISKTNALGLSTLKCSICGVSPNYYYSNKRLSQLKRKPSDQIRSRGRGYCIICDRKTKNADLFCEKCNETQSFNKRLQALINKSRGKLNYV